MKYKLYNVQIYHVLFYLSYIRTLPERKHFVKSLSSFYSLTVAPTHVSISGSSEARVGDVVPLTCTTAPSNPPAEIKWMVGGRQIRNATSRTMVSPEGK